MAILLELSINLKGTAEVEIAWKNTESISVTSGYLEYFHFFQRQICYIRTRLSQFQQLVQGMLKVYARRYLKHPFPLCINCDNASHRLARLDLLQPRTNFCAGIIRINKN